MKQETWNKCKLLLCVHKKATHQTWLLVPFLYWFTWLWLLAKRKCKIKPSNHLKLNAIFTIHLFEIGPLVVIFSRRPFSSILFHHSSSLFSQKELIKPGLVWTRGRSGIYVGERMNYVHGKWPTTGQTKDHIHLGLILIRRCRTNWIGYKLSYETFACL